MKRFVPQAIVFLALQGGIAWSLVYFRPRPVGEDDFLAASIDKHDRLRTASRPRMVFVGGSSLAFGLDGEIILDRTGYQPVNMGLMAQLGLDFMINEVRDSLQPGDVLVLMPEYVHFGSHNRGSPLVHLLLTQRPKSARLLDAAGARWLLDKGVAMYIGEVGRSVAIDVLGLERGPDMRPPYVRSAFNRFGDVSMHWQMAQPEVRPTRRTDIKYQPEYLAGAIERLNALYDEFRAKGVAVFLIYPWLIDRHYKMAEDDIDKIHTQLTAALRIPVLNTPVQTRRPQKLFFDTRYHLNREGTIKRCDRLIELLTPHLPRPKHVNPPER